MNDKLYTKEHEWISIEKDKIALLGITDYAQKQLGDIVFVELPEVDKDCSIGDEIAVVESVKAASEVYSGVSGKVIAVNESIINEPQIINNDPENEGWFVKIEINNFEDMNNLMSLNEYQSFCSSLE